jgi:hypothetical protein
MVADSHICTDFYRILPLFYQEITATVLQGLT